MQEYIEIGQVVNVFGVRGEVKVIPFTDDITRFDDLKQIYLEKNKEKKTFFITSVKYHKNMVILKLEGIDTREEAEHYRNSSIIIDRKDAIKLPKDTYFIVDLIGLPVYTDTGEKLGIVEDIYNTGSNDIYVVKNDFGKQILLPSIPEVLKEIDLEKGKITVHIMKGLLD